MANLIIYYSRKGQNYWSGSIVDLKKGGAEAAQSESKVAAWAKKSV